MMPVRSLPTCVETEHTRARCMRYLAEKHDRLLVLERLGDDFQDRCHLGLGCFQNDFVQHLQAAIINRPGTVLKDLICNMLDALKNDGL